MTLLQLTGINRICWELPQPPPASQRHRPGCEQSSCSQPGPQSSFSLISFDSDIEIWISDCTQFAQSLPQPLFSQTVLHQDTGQVALGVCITTIPTLSLIFPHPVLTSPISTQIFADLQDVGGLPVWLLADISDPHPHPSDRHAGLARSPFPNTDSSLTSHLQAWFVDGYNRQRQLTPNFILVLFIVSILACAWAIATLFRLSSTRRSARFVGLVDLAFLGAFIAGVYELRGIANASCSNFSTGDIYVNLGIFGYYGRETSNGGQWSADVNKNCAMLKASWAFGIMNIISFFITSILAFLLRRHQKETREEVVRRSHHGSRRGHSTSSRRRHSSSSRR